jgi:single-strand DNA-binding protein
MSGSVNTVILIGNVGKVPEIKRLQSGNRVASFSIATSESWRDKNSGERQEKTEWHQISVWGSGDSGGLAGIVEKYVNKGDKVYVKGQLQTRQWEDQSGQKRYTTEVVLRGFNAELQLLSQKKDGGGGGGRERDDDTRSSRGKMHDEMNDEIPF